MSTNLLNETCVHRPEHDPEPMQHMFSSSSRERSTVHPDSKSYPNCTAACPPEDEVVGQMARPKTSGLLASYGAKLEGTIKPLTSSLMAFNDES